MAKSQKTVVIDRKAQILGSAGIVFSKKGYHDASIADIIEHAGIARGTFYLYFEHKRDVFDELLKEFLSQLDELIKPVVLMPGSPDPLTQLKDNILNILNLIKDQHDVAKILLHQSTGLDKRSSEAVELFYSGVLEMIENAIKIGVSLNLIRKCNTKITAIIALGTVKEVAIFVLNNPKDKIPLSEISDEIIQYSLKGMINL